MTSLARRQNIVPGFRVTLGVTLCYLALMVIIPLAGLVFKTSTLSWDQLWHTLTSARVLAAVRLSVGAALAAAAVNAVFGTLLAWVLTRYKFPGRSLVDAMVDLPVALPTAVAGLALTAIYSEHGVIGRITQEYWGWSIAFTPTGVFIALVFVGIPFLVRTVQPVLQDLEKAHEEAGATLGASSWQNFRFILLPQLAPAILTGAALAFGRAVGEYGSVIFIAGNVPMISEIAPLMIISKLEQYDYAGATAIALLLLGISIIVLMTVNHLQARLQHYRQPLV
ncbi:MAG TPA: sulfate ABC transporter permease subunit CysT [Oligoflexus sp.]|uniref:sulfate ABC transporter permease subunit CysT n=1 Tax=Oligoflexus sp. TaxID=1971216 RepID=UPI002D5FD395|nr:sulfate ABC transporter permease subunit CysT [Oligoflexus sp.]HYX36125.1 sulfate ABC transporter permease subunit CysT [Oligoflexus sp.]